MLCPKCGREYEGTKCPNCDGLDIIVNQDDYLKRRKEYEEKQAVLKSAFSDNEEKNKSNEALRPDEILDKIVKVSGQARQKIADKKAEKKRQRWQSIAEAAAKQSGRGIVPEVGEVVSFGEACTQAQELAVRRQLMSYLSL